MSGGLGFLVLLLSALGVYGVVALDVTNRTREFGVRMAMGATRRTILRGALGDAVRLAVPGLVGGGLLSAGLAPALKASAIQPVEALRAE